MTVAQEVTPNDALMAGCGAAPLLNSKGKFADA